MNSKSDRARQFMPFAALKGYEELVRQQEKIVARKRELSEYRAEQLSKKLSSVKKGDMIKIIYYANDGYIKTEGMVSSVDFVLRTLTVIKTKISFDDVYDLAGDSISPFEETF